MKKFTYLTVETRTWLLTEGFTECGITYYPSVSRDNDSAQNQSERQDFRNLQTALPPNIVSSFLVSFMHSDWIVLNRVIQACLTHWDPAFNFLITTPLGRAVLHNNLEVAGELLEKGALRFDEDLNGLSEDAKKRLKQVQKCSDGMLLSLLGQHTGGNKLPMLELLLPHVTITQEVLESAEELFCESCCTRSVRTLGTFFGVQNPSNNRELLHAINVKWQEQGNDSFRFR